jgi:hypothetical protein
VAKEEKAEIEARKEEKKAAKEAKEVAKLERMATKKPKKALDTQDDQESGSDIPSTLENRKVGEKATQCGRVVKTLYKI